MKEEILKRIDALADKLGTTAQYLFGLYVKQAHVGAVIDGIALVLSIAGIVVGALLIRSHQKYPPESQYDFPARLVFGIILCVAFGSGVIGSAFTIPTELLNPEYWAFRHILEDLHGQ